MAKLIGLHEASIQTGLSPSTLRRRVKAKQIPAFRAYSEHGKILFHPKILEMYIEQLLMKNTGGFEDEDFQNESNDETVEMKLQKMQLSTLFEDEE